MKIYLLLLTSDPDIDPLTVTGLTQPANGTASINPDDTVNYTPDLNFNGNDSFTYTIDDGNGGTDTAVVNVTVIAVNDPPVADDDSATTQEATAVTIDVLANDSDVDGDILSVYSVTQGGSGSVTNNGTSVTYTPDLGFTGTDSFTYTAYDGMANSNVATVSVTVNPEPVQDVFNISDTVPGRGENRHPVAITSPGGATSMYVKLTWSGRGDLRLRIYSPSGEIVAEVDESKGNNKVEEVIVYSLGVGNWEVSAISDSKRRTIDYVIEGVVNY
jgi:hypothetical protein